MMPEQNPNKPRMVPLYAARVEDLREGQFVGVICENCGHAADVAVQAIQARMSGRSFVSHIDRRLKCDKCGKSGKVSGTLL
jgi:hypothetical protein